MVWGGRPPRRRNSVTVEEMGQALSKLCARSIRCVGWLVDASADMGDLRDEPHAAPGYVSICAMFSRAKIPLHKSSFPQSVIIQRRI